MELFEQTASVLSEMLQKKECSAVELCQSVQGRIAAVEEKVGAYVTQCEDALEQAEAVDKARAAGEILHPAGLAFQLALRITFPQRVCGQLVLLRCWSSMYRRLMPL